MEREAREGCKCVVCEEIRRKGEMKISWGKAHTLAIPPFGCKDAAELLHNGRSWATIAYSALAGTWCGTWTDISTERAMAFFCEEREEARILCEALYKDGRCVATPWSAP